MLLASDSTGCGVLLKSRAGAWHRWPCCCRAVFTAVQHSGVCQAPWLKIIVGIGVECVDGLEIG